MRWRHWVPGTSPGTTVVCVYSHCETPRDEDRSPQTSPARRFFAAVPPRKQEKTGIAKIPGNFTMDRSGVAGYTPQGMYSELRSRGGRQGSGGSALRAGVALVLAVLLLMTPGVAFAQAGAYDDEAVRQSRDRVLADGSYQTERPEPEELPRIEPFTIPPWLAETLLWAVLVGVGALVLFFLGNLALDLLRNRTAFQRNRDRPGEGTLRIETPPAEARTLDRATLAEADRLAGEGRFSEAIHLLLLVALARLQRELGARVAPAMTGRELLHLPALPGGTVEPLARMVQLSEINHFGGRRAGEPDYRNARADFLRFNGEEPAAA